MSETCNKCGVELTDDNWYPSRQKSGNYICKGCYGKQRSSWRYNNPDKIKAQNARSRLKRGGMPMSENKKCAAYLGVHVAERVLRHLFNDVEVMPYGNPGYDIICNMGKKIDVKGGCILKNNNGWTFRIAHNVIADYFICVAFDNREDLNPLHIWMLPGEKFNHLTGASISQSTIHKWDEYKQDIDKIIACCDILKGD